MKNSKEKEWIQKLSNKQEKILFAKILDCYHYFEKTGISRASDFLNQNEQKNIERGLQNLNISYQVYLPNDVCERSIIYFGEFQDFVSFYCISISSVVHSDVLGSLFGCGFTSSMIGDIFLDDTGVYFTNLTKYNSVLEASLRKIGKFPIALQRLETLPCILKKFQTISLSLTSTRIDLVVAKLVNLSRSRALEYMSRYQTLVNYQSVSKNILLKEEDILSIEHVGKYVVREISLTKKGRKCRVVLQKYC